MDVMSHLMHVGFKYLYSHINPPDTHIYMPQTRLRILDCLCVLVRECRPSHCWLKQRLLLDTRRLENLGPLRN